jgi:hypothetical protein
MSDHAFDAANYIGGIPVAAPGDYGVVNAMPQESIDHHDPSYPFQNAPDLMEGQVVIAAPVAFGGQKNWLVQEPPHPALPLPAGFTPRHGQFLVTDIETVQVQHWTHRRGKVHRVWDERHDRARSDRFAEPGVSEFQYETPRTAKVVWFDDYRDTPFGPTPGSFVLVYAHSVLGWEP